MFHINDHSFVAGNEINEWLGVRIERKLGNRAAEGGFASQLRSRYPSSMEYQEFLKGNFE
jgi:type IV pilus assembly protein PilF